MFIRKQNAYQKYDLDLLINVARQKYDMAGH
jgi:hypothetical protein